LVALEAFLGLVDPRDQPTKQFYPESFLLEISFLIQLSYSDQDQRQKKKKFNRTVKTSTSNFLLSIPTICYYRMASELRVEKT